MTRKETTKFLSDLLIKDRFMVPVPVRKGWHDEKDLYVEFENPTELDPNIEWELRIIKPAHPQNRKYSLAELLFCMLRSGQD